MASKQSANLSAEQLDKVKLMEEARVEGDHAAVEVMMDSFKQGCVLEEFKEVEDVKSIISSISSIYGDQIAVEMAVEKFLFIVDQYQEQPHLLDPHLESLIIQLLNISKNPEAPVPVIHLAFKLLYLITKTRGYKIVVRLMPHEVADLEPVLALLDKQNPTDFQTWETRYMLLLWLSMVCMIPFDMRRLDSAARAQGAEGMKPTMERIIDAGRKYLDVSDKSRDAASYMLSKFMTRHDVKEQKLPEFLDNTLITMTDTEVSSLKKTMFLMGVMRTLALLFKTGKREDLIKYAPTVLKLVTDSKLKLQESSNTAVRKLAIKLIQRLGLTFLKARVAAWRYQRGSRSLADTLGPEQLKAKSARIETVQDDEDEYDIPDEVEDVIEQLLNGLKDKDTIVRWSAAKGIGRVVGRLPKDLADEVVGSIMELFTRAEGDTAWHGGCLALAELGRRGLLLPQRLNNVVPVILKSLLYDEKRGNFSVGAHVRDAACYVCWAFARAYDPEEVKPYVEKIATALIIVTLFDREVNVRRAASAAFQENVGRQGQFPHGIDILTTCDYYAVGNRNTCYLNLSVYVAQFPEYTNSLIEHLVDIKISHWDKSVRELSAEALFNLTQKAPDHMTRSILPRLISKATSMELSLRHGAILSAACVTHALAQLSAKADKQRKQNFTPSEDVYKGLREITQKLNEAKLFRGIGGDLMREAVCYLIRKLSLAHCPFHQDDILENWQNLLDDCLQHQQEEIRDAAVGSISAFFSEYYKQSDGKAKVEIQEKILTKYLSQLESKTEVVRQGYALALGSMPKFMLQGQFEHVLKGLIQASKHNDAKNRMPESQRDALKAFTLLCQTVGVDKTGSPKDCVCAANIDEIYAALLVSIKNYIIDNRGDVGALIREAGMTGLHDLTVLVMTKDSTLLSESVCHEMICSLSQQACEKIDRTRAHAAEIFNKLLFHKPPIEKIPRRTELVEIFTPRYGRQILWNVPKETFPKFVKMLSFPEYKYSTLLGLTVSVGGLTESLVRFSSGALRDYLREKSLNISEMEKFGATLLKIFRDYQKVDRITLPLLKMIDQYLAMGTLTLLFETEGCAFGPELYTLTKQEITKCGEPQKILASIDVFCGMLVFPGDNQKKILFQLMVFLCHKYPIVRKTTANKLYEAMVTFDGLVEDDAMDEIMTILSDTQWDKPVAEVRPVRNSLCDMFGINQPVIVNKVDAGK